MKAVLQLSDELAAELLETDHLVISTPVYNYNVPAALKAWVDHVVRKGLTLGVDGKGLVTGKKATVLSPREVCIPTTRRLKTVTLRPTI
jgi:FMN-dependent NADH-azoreductase